MPRYLVLVALMGAAILPGCSGESGERNLAAACRHHVDTGGRELEQARADGLSDSVAWTKAASLLAAAKVQQQFEEYENCLIKAREARQYLATIGK